MGEGKGGRIEHRRPSPLPRVAPSAWHICSSQPSARWSACRLSEWSAGAFRAYLCNSTWKHVHHMVQAAASGCLAAGDAREAMNCTVGARPCESRTARTSTAELSGRLVGASLESLTVPHTGTRASRSPRRRCAAALQPGFICKAIWTVWWAWGWRACVQLR
jgi:hypothetical protein